MRNAPRLELLALQIGGESGYPTPKMEQRHHEIQYFPPFISDEILL